MYDGAITKAKEALKVFVHSLPEGSKFCICSFGSSFEFTFKQKIEDYNEENMNIAINDINTFDERNSNMGGTEIY